MGTGACAWTTVFSEPDMHTTMLSNSTETSRKKIAFMFDKITFSRANVGQPQKTVTTK
jgi:hypothetical protein